MTDIVTPAVPPIAKVKGEAFTDMPHDLYIPPDALEIFLETFQGPLDLLLYLIKRENLDILDIPIARVTQQYIDYIGLMVGLRLELAAEYLLMAAMLAEIKSRMLLPRPVEVGEELDPRAELVRRLLEYERYKQAAAQFDVLPQMGRDVFQALAEARFKSVTRPLPKVTLDELLRAFNDALARAAMYTHHHFQRDPLSVRERMSQILSRIRADQFTEFHALFPHEEGRGGVVVTFLALLELIKESLVELVQHDLYGTIHIRSASA